MPKYVSRRYLREKYDNLKWDMEKTFDIYGEDHDADKIDEATLKRCYREIIEMCKAIEKEVNIENQVLNGPFFVMNSVVDLFVSYSR